MISLFAPALLLLPLAAPQDAGSVDDALAAIDAVRASVPTFDRTRGRDEKYLAEFRAKQNEILGDLSDKIFAFYQQAPAHPRTAPLLGERWKVRAQVFNEADTVLEEIAEVVASARPGGLVAAEGRFWSANIVINHRTQTGFQFSFEDADARVRDVLRAGDDDGERLAWLLKSLAGRAPEGSERQLELYRLLVADYAKTANARGVEAQLKQIESLGKPFELAFTDAISGREISMAGLRGKVVVVDFWATWCGPCIRDLPHMLDLYERYRPQGVEFVGISLDHPPEQGGLQKLKDFVAAREIPWPQYYQGKGWNSEFSSGWGVQSIPAVFLVDQRGTLVSVNARGRLESLLTELLAQGTR